MSDVWAVAFDESADGSDPLLRVFASNHAARSAIRRMAVDTPFEHQLVEDMDEFPAFTLNYYDPDEGDRLMVSLRHVKIEELERVMAEGKL